MSKPLLALLLLLASPSLLWAAEEPAAAGAEAGQEGEAEHVDWHSWHAGNEVSNLSSLQRGARNFFAYCANCHSLKYMRYSRMAEDLKISTEQLQQFILPPDAKAADYIVAGGLSSTDATSWFGKEPPDLSLITRARHGGADYVYRFLKTFYVDPTRPTNSNNLQLAGAAMPAILSDLGGVQEAVFKEVESVVDGRKVVAKEFSHFELSTPGLLTPAQFDAFVRDTVNFLDYVGEPAQVARRGIGVWVILFLLAFTWMTWLLKKEYWKDVH